MSGDLKVGLICTTHDKDGNNLDRIREFGHIIKELYDYVYITISDETHKDIYKSLKYLGFNIKIIRKNGAADARRKVLSFGLEEKIDFYHIDLLKITI